MQDECNLFHVHNWIQFFVSIYNNVTTTKDNSDSKNRNSDKETIDKTDIKVEEKFFDNGGGFFFRLFK